MAYPLPDPPLDDGVVRLRPWEPDDADALAAAWGDEQIRRWTLVPNVRGEAEARTHARRWIENEAVRRERGLALDLVVSPSDPAERTVLGEVGLVTMAGGPSRAEIGWWVAAEHRRRGVATRAVGLFTHWCRTDLGLELFAEVDPDNPASIWVAEGAGIRIRLR